MPVSGPGASVHASVTFTGRVVLWTANDRTTVSPAFVSTSAGSWSYSSRAVESSTAPTFTLPHPCSAFGPPPRSVAVLASSAFVIAGEGAAPPGTVRSYQSRVSAAAPDTTGAACDVPETSE